MRRSSLLLLGVAVVLAAGCGGSGRPESSAPSSTAQPVVTDTIVADPPTIVDGREQPDGPPPPPAPDRNTVSWAEAKRLVVQCKVRELFQAHSLYVELQLKDGRKLNTREPGIDDVLHLQQRAGCAGVPIAVE